MAAIIRMLWSNLLRHMHAHALATKLYNAAASSVIAAIKHCQLQVMDPQTATHKINGTVKILRAIH